ncbi:hypothetical protein PAUR_a0157 [Pseudoalteromonas aurantia 208]|uniref:Orphan protein n=1 Tax=Pseudoalteromonas aurantia 208 TaxID=1314867 RepID=A0ABR9E7C8_9GAMM|nr:hypothetical protein [Pseudoalteromonas aurantia 208]
MKQYVALSFNFIVVAKFNITAVFNFLLYRWPELVSGSIRCCAVIS